MRAVESIFEIGILDYSKVSRQASKTVVPTSGNRNKVDILPHIPTRTIFMRVQGKDAHKKAMQRAKKKGTVVFCNKVQTSYYLNKIEYLNLNQVPLTVEIEMEQEFELSKALEISNPQKRMLEQKYEIELIDRGE